MKKADNCIIKCAEVLLGNLAATGFWQTLTSPEVAAPLTALGATPTTLGLGCVAAFLGVSRFFGGKDGAGDNGKILATLRALRKGDKKAEEEIKALTGEAQLNFKEMHRRFTRLEQMMTAVGTADSTDTDSLDDFLRQYFAEHRDLFFAFSQFVEDHFDALRAVVDKLPQTLAELRVDMTALSQQLDKVHDEVFLTHEDTREIKANIQKILDAIEEKKKAPAEQVESPFPPEVLQAARHLLERGSREEKALALSVQRRSAEAEEILAALSVPSEEDLFRLLTRRGDNWYLAGKFDQAIDPYEKALALRPNDLTARNNALIAHSEARLGDIAVHRCRAIDIGAGTLKLLPDNSSDWAMTQNNLGNAWRDLPTGDRGANVGKAIACYAAALEVYTKEAHPVQWAGTQNNLGAAWGDLPTGDRGANVGKAIACYAAALEVYTKEAHPVQWAGTQNNLGNAWGNLPTGDRGANVGKAIACYAAALEVYTKEAHPVDWAMTQNNLGAAWGDLPTGDRGANVGKAIACYAAALEVYTKEAHPVQWAGTQNNLGNAWGNLPTGDRGANVGKAIACYAAALEVYTKEAHPVDWAMTQNNLGNAWGDLPTGDRGANVGKAIACYAAALEVRTKEAHPVDWAMTQNNLGAAWRNLPTGDRGANVGKAIACYAAALEVYTKEAHPVDWAMTQNNLGAAWGDLPTGDRGANVGKAIACYAAALEVYTKEAHPVQWAGTQNNLAIALAELAALRPEERCVLLRRSVASRKAALTICTAEDFPHEHADTMHNLAIDRRTYEAWGCGKELPFEDIAAAE